MTLQLRLPLALGAALALTAGAANAQVAGASLRDAVFRADAKAAATLASPIPASAVGVAYAGAPAERPAGVAKTAIDHAFDRKTTASVGFLCGLDSRLDNAGGMGAYGTDPQGRFIGAKLHLAFR